MHGNRTLGNTSNTQSYMSRTIYRAPPSNSITEMQPEELLLRHRRVAKEQIIDILPTNYPETANSSHLVRPPTMQRQPKFTSIEQDFMILELFEIITESIRRQGYRYEWPMVVKSAPCQKTPIVILRECNMSPPPLVG